jgi:hypothetical protein
MPNGMPSSCSASVSTELEPGRQAPRRRRVNRLIIPAAAITAATLAGAVSLAACTSGATTYPSPASVRSRSTAPSTSAGAHGGPMIPATESAPPYLGDPNPRSSTPAGPPLPLARSVAANATSIPWGLVSRDESGDDLTVEVAYGGCTPAPFGYTAITYEDHVVIAIYSTDIVLPSGDGCAAVGQSAVYRLILPSADAKLSLAHAPYQ